MRDRRLAGALKAQVIAGTHVVLFGFDVAASARTGLLGFAIQREDLVTGAKQWLPNFLRFAHNDRADGPSGSDLNPLQAFQWGDYTVEPGQRLRYRVQAMYGEPEQLRVGDEVELEVQTELADDGRHGVYFNRGVAGSQAYARKFGRVSPLNIPDAQTWLSRGLEEGLLAFIERAEGPGWALRGAFYEFQHEPVLRALHAAALRGADLELSVSCPLLASGWPDYPSWHNIEAIRKQKGSREPPRKGLSQFSTPRLRSKDIAHNKFLVLVRDGQPQAVWTGSTNITAGGLWGHSNVGHLVGDPRVAAQYLIYWDQLHADLDGDALVAWTTANSTIEPGGPLGGTSTLFSPRLDTSALSHYVDLIKEADQAVFFTAAFGVSDEMEEAFRVASDVPRYLLLEEPDNDMELARADPDNHIAAGAYLDERGGWRQFLEEHLTGLNEHVRYIHTKYLLVDPLTDDPVVVTGSANFSRNSTLENDENMLIIRDEPRVADIYLTEFMRLFTHLRFRARVNVKPEERAPDPAEPAIRSPLHLDDTGAWTAEYFEPNSPKERERLLFSGQL